MIDPGSDPSVNIAIQNVAVENPSGDHDELAFVHGYGRPVEDAHLAGNGDGRDPGVADAVAQRQVDLPQAAAPLGEGYHRGVVDAADVVERHVDQRRATVHERRRRRTGEPPAHREVHLAEGAPRGERGERGAILRFSSYS